jgi:hypothetical protein
LDNPQLRLLSLIKGDDNLIVTIDLGEWWKPLEYKDVKPMYEISNLGRVRNINTGNVLSISISEKGYSMVSLMTNKGTQDTFKLHRIMAFNFLDLPDFNDGSTWTVNHKSGNKRDCSVDNLEWSTFSENIQHAFDTGLNKPLKGENNGNSKYSESIIRAICQLLEDGYTNRQILKIFREEYPDMNRFFLYDLRHKKTWKHISDEYNY